MPHSSLWLLPSPNHPIYPHLENLIRKTSSHFSSPHPSFSPHITLSSDILPTTFNPAPQQWLDKLPFPAGVDVHVRLAGLGSEEVYFRKLYLGAVKEGVEREGLRMCAKVGRGESVGFKGGDMEGLEEWVVEEWRPHLSLLYHDIPRVGEDELKVVEEWVEEVKDIIRKDGNGGELGWTGGEVWLVPTEREVEEWVPIARRVL